MERNIYIFNILFFCPRCYFALRPQKNNEFAFFDKDKGYLIIYKFKSNEKVFKPISPGFTPHLMIVTSYNERVVKYQLTCSIKDCGIEINRSYDPELPFSIDLKDIDDYTKEVEVWRNFLNRAFF